MEQEITARLFAVLVEHKAMAVAWLALMLSVGVKRIRHLAWGYAVKLFWRVASPLPAALKSMHLCIDAAHVIRRKDAQWVDVTVHIVNLSVLALTLETHKTTNSLVVAVNTRNANQNNRLNHVGRYGEGTVEIVGGPTIVIGARRARTIVFRLPITAVLWDTLRAMDLTGAGSIEICVQWAFAAKSAAGAVTHFGLAAPLRLQGAHTEERTE